MPLFIELSLIVFIATLVAIIMRLLKQPLIVGYILSGILVGPYALNILHANEEVELFAKIGISTLLFIVGLHLNPDTIRETGRGAIVSSTIQIVLTSLFGFGISHLFGWDIISSLLVGLAMSFSSTIIVLKLLSDSGDLNKLYGKISVGMLLVEDLVATFALLIIAVLGNEATNQGISMVVFDLAMKGGLAFICLYICAKYILPKFSYFLAHTPELLFLFSISWGLGLAALFSSLGFSIEIGALVAGVTLSVSPYAQEIGSRMKPLRDFFIIIFFVVLGSHLVFSDLPSLIYPILAFSALALFIKPLVVIFAVNLAGYRPRTGFLAGSILGQISEFSLIMVTLAHTSNLIDGKVVSLIAMVAIISIVGSTYVAAGAHRFQNFLRPVLNFISLRKKTKREVRMHCEQSDVLIFGYDRVGFDFVQAAQKLESSYMVVDINPKSIKKLQEEGVPFSFGDAEDVEFLHDICFSESKIVVSTIPDFRTNMLLLRTYRKTNSEGIIILISHDIKEAKELYLNGATYVIMPHYLGAHHASTMISQFGFDISKFEKERNKHLTRLAQREKTISKLVHSN